MFPNGQRDWAAAVNILHTELNVEQLDLRIDMSYVSMYLHAAGNQCHCYQVDSTTSEMEENEWSAALLVIENMSRFQDWKHVSVHLSRPWHDEYTDPSFISNPLQNQCYPTPGEISAARRWRERVM